jgi:hypothetical protein
VLALNSQELRQATYWGPFINLMNDISDKEIWQKLNIFTQNDIRRMLDVEYISELTVAFLKGPQNKKNKLDEYYRFYEEEFEEGQYVEDVFSTVLSEIYKILPEIAKTFVPLASGMPISLNRKGPCLRINGMFASEKPTRLTGFAQRLGATHYSSKNPISMRVFIFVAIFALTLSLSFSGKGKQKGTYGTRYLHKERNIIPA